MNQLGRLMKDDLTTVSCVAESTPIDVQCVLSGEWRVCISIHVQSRPVRSSNACNMFRLI